MVVKIQDSIRINGRRNDDQTGARDGKFLGSQTQESGNLPNTIDTK